VAINNGEATVAPSEKTVLNGSYQPLSRPLFIYVNEKSAQRKEVKDFVNFYLKNGAKYARKVKYIPLPSSAYNLALRNFQKPKLRTVFGGKEAVGLRIDELLKREAQQ
jgi:phosphate transport system substrate-binding protein